jgi:Protein of unknown function (DUF3800)
MLPQRTLRLFYIDDSGANDTGIASASWLECSANDWHAVRSHWLDMRRKLNRTYGVPASTVLHSTDFVGGRKEPSSDPRFNASKEMRHEAMEFVLGSLGECGDVRIGTLYRRTDSRKSDFFAEKLDLFGRLFAHLDTRLGDAGEIGIIYVDGREKEAEGYSRAFRSRRRRNIIEEPNFQQAKGRQLLQAADVIAWTAYQSILRYPGKERVAGWYDTYLRALDVHGGPLAV